MELIRSFAALSLVCGAALLLLPEGSLRRAASLAMGLMLALFWLQGLTKLLRLPQLAQAPATILAPSAAAPDAASALSALATHAAGTPIAVTADEAGLLHLAPEDAALLAGGQ